VTAQAELRPWRRAATAALLALVAALVAATLLAALAAFHWFADLLVHFRVQYALLALVSAAAAVALRHGRLLAVSALVCAVNLPGAAAELLPGEVGQSGGAPVVRLELAAANLWYRNPRPELALQWLEREDCDVAFLMEVTPAWRAALRGLERRYPHQRYVAGPRGRGVLLLSRWPLSEASVPRLASGEGRALFVTVTRDGAPLRLALMHASWPFGPALSRARAVDLAALAAEARAHAGRPLVVLGDLNVTPLSPHFRQLLAAGALRDAAAGRGWQPTWPVAFPPLGIRIDHALVGDGVAVRDYRRGPAIGSDHRPLRLGVAYRGLKARASSNNVRA
jgi:endonuclease/exonuclease/phosphatase (EEP) superfamily protein YafD